MTAETPERAALRLAVIAEIREAASCQSDDGDECRKCTRHADAVLAAVDAQEPRTVPELAASMRETRLIRERLTALAAEQDRDADADDKARDGQRDGVSRLLLQRHAGLRRRFAASLREIAGVPS